MKRYQNPDIFEHLAMSYALGTLQGKARLRFEKLMSKHLYLRAVANAYQQQFAPLANLIPRETPPARVWNAISQQLQLGKTTVSPKSWFARMWSQVPLTAFAAVIASVGTVLLLNLSHQPDIYMANLKTPVQQDKMMVAMVYHDTMEIAFDMPVGALPVKGDMMPTVWCIHKDSSKKPMRMGTLTANADNRMPIDKETWQEMANISQFAISLEPMDKPPSDTPQGKVVFSGELAAL
ncbi:MAG: hypothetical protein BWK73_05760 [Thiothrix lacustris]|uniref:Anti-sigma K factor RskA C-terminal domain-containing protein n=1 Tax=Thiothrix lacustris TaxID=525917 RepID=A0A1Y1QXP8_9GAMM|nr:MAG: hypothetical protein BWK73_05760 [Thiothrix lacustris]